MSKRTAVAEAGGSLRSYVSGFLVSVYLTLTAYLMVVHHLAHGWALALAIAGLAVVQLTVQLIFFLHLGREARPRWRLTVFWFMLLVVVIMVSGSLWIMSNLDYHHSQPPSASDVNQFMKQNQGL